MGETCCGSKKEPEKIVKSCCGSKPEPVKESSSGGCCGPSNSKIDYLLWVSIILTAIGYLLHFVNIPLPVQIMTFSHSVFEFMNTMWWGIVAGIFFIGILNYIPKDVIMTMLGTNKGTRGIVRATFAGVLFDLCSHGVLMVAMKLYERGASLGQVMAFLIASPWNSISLTLILWGLVGFKWMMTFLILSMIIGFISGIIFDKLVEKKILPANPNTSNIDPDMDLKLEIKKLFSSISISFKGVINLIKTGAVEGKIVIKWMFVGIVLAALVRVFIAPDVFQEYFGPTLVGLGLATLFATIIEVCSEGTTPLAADMLTRANAPGNSFSFMMTGVSTDYTEVMVLKDTTKSWKIALFLPLVTVPQVLFCALILNGTIGF